MKKTELLRKALVAESQWCKARPEQLTVWAEKGGVEIEATGEASFLYRYEIRVLVTDFPEHIDALMLPTLAWVCQQQPDLLLNPDSNKKISFEADILSDDTADVLITIPVWERVIITRQGGVTTAKHLPEDRPLFYKTAWDEVFFDPSDGEVAL
ncbi:phage tail protein [Enterobacteriaceae bacterium ENNIH1]|nr:phage tail protein [Enterobacteriaceae bacterium ENNIH1]